jgi:peroxin-7
MPNSRCPSGDDFPIAMWGEHREEASSVDWNLVEKTTFLSSSWDGSIRVCATEMGRGP